MQCKVMMHGCIILSLSYNMYNCKLRMACAHVPYLKNIYPTTVSTVSHSIKGVYPTSPLRYISDEVIPVYINQYIPRTVSWKMLLEELVPTVTLHEYSAESLSCADVIVHWRTVVPFCSEVSLRGTGWEVESVDCHAATEPAALTPQPTLILLHV